MILQTLSSLFLMQFVCISIGVEAILFLDIKSVIIIIIIISSEHDLANSRPCLYKLSSLLAQLCGSCIIWASNSRKKVK